MKAENEVIDGNGYWWVLTYFTYYCHLLLIHRFFLLLYTTTTELINHIDLNSYLIYCSAIPHQNIKPALLLRYGTVILINKFRIP